MSQENLIGLNDKNCIKVTIPLLKKLHREYNEKYFGGTLSDIPITLNNKSKHLGFYKHVINKETMHLDNVCISISKRYILSEAGLRNLLVHEMLHQWYTEHLSTLYPARTELLYETYETYIGALDAYNNSPIYAKTENQRIRVKTYCKTVISMYNELKISKNTCHEGVWYEEAERLNSTYPELHITPTCDLAAEVENVKYIGKVGTKDCDVLYFRYNSRYSNEICKWEVIKPSKSVLVNGSPLIEFSILCTGNMGYIAHASRDLSSRITVSRNQNKWYKLRTTPNELLEKGLLLSIEPLKIFEYFTKNQRQIILDEYNIENSSLIFKMHRTLIEYMNNPTEAKKQIDLIIPPEDDDIDITDNLDDYPNDEQEEQMNDTEEINDEPDELGQYSFQLEAIDIVDDMDEFNNGDIELGLKILPDGSIENTIA